jgi:hypothetical protein
MNSELGLDEELDDEEEIVSEIEDAISELGDETVVEDEEVEVAPVRERRVRERVYVTRKLHELVDWACEKAESGQSVGILTSNQTMGVDVLKRLKEKGAISTRLRHFQWQKGQIVVAWEPIHLIQTKFDSIGMHREVGMDLVAATGFPFTGAEMQRVGDALLRTDADRELCRQCKEADPNSLPYGKETGHIEWAIQYDKEGAPILDEEDNALYVGYPELQCSKGHRWYLGEGPRRDIRGINPILFESHLEHRDRRSVQTKDGVPDPAYTMDRWGKRPIQGMYWRQHPQGRKVNSNDQRKRGAGFYH